MPDSLEWQSFETQLRYQRAERCLLFAEAALEAGLEEDARAAVAQASALDPNTPAFELIRDAVCARQAAALAARRRARNRRFAAAAALVVTVGAGGFALRNSARVPATGAFTAVPTTRSPEAAPAVRLPESPTATEPPPDTRPVPALKTRADVEARPIEGEESSSLPGIRDLERAGPTRSGIMELPEVQASARPVAIEDVVTGLPAAALPPTALPAVTLPPTTAPASAPPAAASPPRPTQTAVELEEAKVRAVLGRFASAYSTLDALAAQEVWLDVDEPSLSRAFESLESQRVSLGRCVISVTGATARAECSGSTTWRPKVGSGERTEPRHWQFDLATANGRWLIVRTRAR